MINVDFDGFWAAVNAIGCVYVDIDRRYFNNSPGYAYIDVQPGYQKMCGREALQYVRFRHEDNDLVRSARQQDFLRQAKQQVGVGKLIDDRDKLVRIFGRYTPRTSATAPRCCGCSSSRSSRSTSRSARSTSRARSARAT